MKIGFFLHPSGGWDASMSNTFFLEVPNTSVNWGKHIDNLITYNNVVTLQNAGNGK